MLKYIHIENFALIDELDLDLSDGLTMVTGETGAGKSIILGALSLIQGNRADLSSVRDVHRKCIVEVQIEVAALALKSFFDEHDLDDEAICFLRREILPSGKSRAFVNDTPVTLSVMKALSDQLIDVHSQHETLQLVSDVFQIDALQSFIEKQTEQDQYPAKTLLNDYRIEWSRLKQDQSQLKELKNQELLLVKEADYNNFLLEELEAVNLDQLDLLSLEREAEQLNNVEEINHVLQEFNTLLDNDEHGVLDVLRSLKTRLNQISSYDKDYEDVLKRLNSVLLELEDLNTEAMRKNDQVVSDPSRLEEVNDRLQLVDALLKKHQAQDLAELIKLRDQLADKVFATQGISKKIKQLEQSVVLKKATIDDLVKKLHHLRVTYAVIFEQEILSLVSQLGLPDAAFKVSIAQTDVYNNYGVDNIGFLFTANKGTTLLPLRKAASGGELSRLMLSIKALLAQCKKMPTIIFDEIDTGVSGAIAEKMALIMKQMSDKLQVLTITHLPQIAAVGNDHLLVKKEVNDNVTRSTILRLSAEERVEEIAQMLSGGKISDAARQNARVLLK